ncbi:MAG TPA: polysaccharide deacetylase [Bosea sp. (in: a-proteobacteria)]|uniref:polysaccharide deacetylase n=1 Tax=Bosea sp. (in: a-proteobacteria) TaxID=1871050 RepID=UPI002E13857A|nr:polysaccharide deacetylase [Bosea sp. (in: a-proteobacteria)]
MAGLGERFALPVLLAVIPMLAEPALAGALRRMPSLEPCQHGSWHRNHAPQGAKKAEFGVLRAATDIVAELSLARRRLEALFGEALLPVFVPPWNRIAPEHAALLPKLGFAGLSCFRGYALGPAGGPQLGNTDLDIMDWGSRTGRRPEELIAEACRLLAAKRVASSPEADAFGILMHHRDHDDAAWGFLDGFLAHATRHTAVAPTAPRSLFQIG